MGINMSKPQENAKFQESTQNTPAVTADRRREILEKQNWKEHQEMIERSTKFNILLVKDSNTYWQSRYDEYVETKGYPHH